MNNSSKLHNPTKTRIPMEWRNWNLTNFYLLYTNILENEPKSKRKITVLNKEYLWVLDGNRIDGSTPQQIKVHAIGATKSILYLDPYNWHFEVRPQTIEKAITFALENGWVPEEAGTSLMLSMNSEGEFYILRDGIKFGYEESE